MIGDIEREQIKEHYDVADLVYALDITIDDFIDAFEDEIIDQLFNLLDRERGIGL